MILTSSFPGGPDDETCGYIREFARRLTTEFSITVLAPPDAQANPVDGEPFRLVRSLSLRPRQLSSFQAGVDLNGLRHARFLYRIGAAIGVFAYFLRALRLALRTDVICSHWMMPAGLVGAALSRCMGKPHVVVEHSGALHLLASAWWGRWLAKFIVKGTERVVLVSEDLRRKIVLLCPEAAVKTAVTPMGVNAGRVDPERNNCEWTLASPTERTVLFLGRLEPIKGTDLLLTAMREIKETRLIVAGDGPERRPLERLARQFELNVQFAGRVNAITRDELIRSSDIVVIPSRAIDGSRTEGMPLICLEAMAAGRAVVVSRTGGLPEIIRDGENGLLFGTDDAGSLAECLKRLVADEALRARLGENARHTAAGYAWPGIIERYARIIRGAIATTRGNTNERSSGLRSHGENAVRRKVESEGSD